MSRERDLMNVQAYKSWLEGRDYREATVRASVRGIEALRKQYDAGTSAQTLAQNFHSYQYLRRYSAWLTQAKLEPADQFDRDALLYAPDGVPLAPRRDRHRKQPAVSVRPDDWAKLVVALQEDDSIEGRALYAMACSALRVGDLLGIERAAVEAALRHGTLVLTQKGGHRRELPIADADGTPTTDAWGRLLDVWPAAPAAKTLAGWLSPASPWGARGGGAAYQRLRRHLQAVAKRVGVHGRIYHHRLRRTVAVRALNTTKDSRLVKDLLGHKSPNSTEYYLDELRAVELAELQQKLNPHAKLARAGRRASIEVDALAENSTTEKKASNGAPAAVEHPIAGAPKRVAVPKTRAAAPTLRTPRCPHCRALAPVQSSDSAPPEFCEHCGQDVVAQQWS